MFTGLIEEIGKIDFVERREQMLRIGVAAEHVTSGLAVGDSIAIDGVCTTAVKCDSHRFECDIMEETARKTTLNDCRIGNFVNLERPLRAEDRLGGHLVQGHVDAVASVRRVVTGTLKRELEILLPEAIAKYVVATGSITVNGVSLTVARIDGLRATVALIPHTWEVTTLKNLQAGAKVNIEVDVIGKYVEKLLKT
ncbi:riboflavin synthase [bacterium]|nr:riboflavin synthase [bacterium]MBU1935926.1 riboflavin synthase [bacterium]